MHVLSEKRELVPSLTKEDARHYGDSLNQADDEDSRCLSQALQAGLCAHDNGVHRSHLVSFKTNGALLQELFTRGGSGSLISNDNFDSELSLGVTLFFKENLMILTKMHR